MQKIIIVIIAAGCLFGFDGALHSQEPERVQTTKKWLEDRGLMPLMKLFEPLFTHAIESRLDKVNEMMLMGKGVRQQMENDHGLQSLARTKGDRRDIELTAVKYISASMFEFFVVIPSSDGPVGFRVGISTYNDKLYLSRFSGSDDWGWIVKMAESFEIFPATVTIHADS